MAGVGENWDPLSLCAPQNPLDCALGFLQSLLSDEWSLTESSSQSRSRHAGLHCAVAGVGRLWGWEFIDHSQGLRASMLAYIGGRAAVRSIRFHKCHVSLRMSSKSVMQVDIRNNLPEN